jgi:hypothetical protein
MAESMGLVDHAISADASASSTIRQLTGGQGCEREMISTTCHNLTRLPDADRDRPTANRSEHVDGRLQHAVGRPRALELEVAVRRDVARDE